MLIKTWAKNEFKKGFERINLKLQSSEIQQISSDVNKQKFVYFILVLLLIIFSVFTFLSKGSYGGADDLWHYYFSRYAFQYPKFYFDLWAKPVFTLLSSPFAQFGYTGYKLFNVITGLLSAFMTYLVARKLKYKNSWLAIIFVCFMPIYTIIMLSGMTEILFSFILILCIYLYINDKVILSAIIISFLPYTRTEGYIILPLFFFIFLIFRNLKSIPFLLTGTLLLTLIGGFYFDDFLWLKNKLPYSASSSGIYGKGELFFYIKSFNSIVGLPLKIFLLAGIYLICIEYKMLITRNKNYYIEIFLIFGSFSIIFAFHSLTWWFGIGTLGMTRFFAAVVPVMALLSVKGISVLSTFIKTHNYIRIYLVIICLIVIYEPFHRYGIPVQLGEVEKLIKSTSEWLKTSGYFRNDYKIYYYDPNFIKFLDLNPFDNQRSRSVVYSYTYPEKGLPINSIVLWDSHFGAQDGRLPFYKLINNECFRIIKEFRPEYEFNTFTGLNYKIAVFQRIKCYNPININNLPDSLYFNERKEGTFIPFVYLDFENHKAREKENLSTNKVTNSGDSACLISKDSDYLIALIDSYQNIFEQDSINIRAFVSVFAEKSEGIDKLNLTISLEDPKVLEDGISRYYFTVSKHLDPNSFKPNKWNILSLNCLVPKPKSPTDIFKVYIHNPEKNEYLVDDFLIERE